MFCSSLQVCPFRRVQATQPGLECGPVYPALLGNLVQVDTPCQCVTQPGEVDQLARGGTFACLLLAGGQYRVCGQGPAVDVLELVREGGASFGLGESAVEDDDAGVVVGEADEVAG